MTKEDLIKTIQAYSSDLSDNLIHDLYEFFDSNVCIPKGINRVKFADELHLMLEGIETEMQLDGFIPWVRCDIKNIRIKPQEPVYEWQYLLTAPNCGCTYTKHMTDEESKHYDIGYYKHMVKVEETKRERK